MNPTTVDRIRGELTRRDLTYGDKKLLAEGKLREIVLDKRGRERGFLYFWLPLLWVLLVDIGRSLTLVFGSREATPSDWVLVGLNSIVMVILVGSAVHCFRENRRYDRWLRELDEEESSASALSEAHA